MGDLKTIGFRTSGLTSAPKSVELSDGSQVALTADQARLVRMVLSEPETVSPKDAAALLGVSRPMVLRWISDGLLADMPKGTHHRIPLESVVALKAARTDAGRAAVAAVEAAENGDPEAIARTAAARARASERIARRSSQSPT